MELPGATHALFFFTGFVTDFTSLAEFYLLRSLADVATCDADAKLINLAWALRPVWGYLSDRAGPRHLQLATLFVFAFAIWMAVRATTGLAGVVTLLALVEIAPAASLTIADAYVVRLTKSDPAAMPKHHRFRIAGRVVASCVSGKALSEFGTGTDTVHALFLAQGLIFLVAAPAFALTLDRERDAGYARVAPSEPDAEASATKPAETPSETPSEPDERWFAHTREVLAIAWRDPQIRLLTIVFTAFAALPDPGTSVMYFVAGPLNISPLALAAADAARGLFDFLGTYARTDVALSSALLANLSVANLLCVPMSAIVTRAASRVLDDRAMILMSSCIGAWIGSAFSTVYSIAVARAAPEGKEGGVYNGIISIPMLGALPGAGLTYALTRAYDIDHDSFGRLPEFVLTTSLAGGAFTVFAALAARRLTTPR